ncbi:phosphonate ABC transporter, permease protein PhnE, partial [Microbacterium sp.]|uniref:phosphonate ABC transporter, permease protein PhnE n=1 Tax=Microbacterium sp. TaxID=51671 RepID=UPI003C7248C6
TPRPTRPRPPAALWLGIAVVAIITVVAAVAIDFTLIPRIRDVDGWLQILSGFAQPNWSYFPRVLGPLWETISTAVVATAIGSVLALVAAMLCSRVTTRNAVVYRVSKLVLAVVRSLPDVVWALLFVVMIGRGPLAGTFALIFFSLGIVAKLTAETVDAVDRGPLEAVDSAGGTGFQRARAAVVPQIVPGYASYVLYVFELNVRASLVLGLVGAGGIGQLIQVQLARYNYENISLIIIVIFVLVFILDQFSGWLRKRLTR